MFYVLAVFVFHTCAHNFVFCNSWKREINDMEIGK